MVSNTNLDENSGIRGFFLEYQLILFFILTFAITWGIAAIILIFMPLFIQAWGPLSLRHPYYYTMWMIAVYGPPIAAFIVISIAYGTKGLKAYYKRLLNWRFKIVGILIVVSYIVICILSNYIYIAIGGTPKNIILPWYMFIFAFILFLIADPGSLEELGWRGFALPHLQKKYNALWSSIILGIIWGIWHLPAFFISILPQSSFSLPLFIIKSVSMSIIMTVAYNKGSKGSIPLALLIHWVANLMYMIFNLQDLLLYLIVTILSTGFAVILILIFGPENLGDEKYTNTVPLNKE